jgi:hypothetical protein
MDSESKLVIELWDKIKDVIPNAKKHDTLLAVLLCLQEYGIELEDLDVAGEDEHLDDALAACLEVELEDEEREEDY